jgi:hypothetical protein
MKSLQLEPEIKLRGQILFVHLPKEPGRIKMGLILRNKCDDMFVTHLVDIQYGIENPGKSCTFDGEYFKTFEEAIKGFQKRLNSILMKYKNTMDELRGYNVDTLPPPTFPVLQSDGEGNDKALLEDYQQRLQLYLNNQGMLMNSLRKPS